MSRLHGDADDDGGAAGEEGDGGEGGEFGADGTDGEAGGDCGWRGVFVRGEELVCDWDGALRGWWVHPAVDKRGELS